jgi:hypothetical protein
MRKSTAPDSPDAYVAALSGWQRDLVVKLRAAVRKVPALQESVKWRNLFYEANGPVLMIRAEEKRVLFGFWRGRRLRDMAPALKPGGKYEMATIELREGSSFSAALATRLAREAVALNESLGDPCTDAA